MDRKLINKTMNKQQVNRNIALDIIRVISALMIVSYHYTTRYFEKYTSNIQFHFSMQWGAWAVATFFILSGFLTSKHINDKSVLKFLISRMKRLYPEYWICLTCSVIIMFFLVPSESKSIKTVLWNYTMLQGFFNIENVDGVYWTLQYELSFLFIFLAFMIIHKYLNLTLEKIILSSLIIMYTFEFLIRFSILQPPLVGGVTLVLNLKYGHLFLLGCSLWCLYTNNNKTICVINILLSVLYCAFDFSKIYMCFVLCDAIVVFGGSSSSLTQKKFMCAEIWIFGAEISYCFYLLHQNIGYAILQQLERYGFQNPIIIIVPFVVCVVLSTIVHFYIVTKIRKKGRWI